VEGIFWTIFRHAVTTTKKNNKPPAKPVRPAKAVKPAPHPEQPARASSGVVRRTASAAAILGRPVAAAAAKHFEPVKIKPQWAKYYKRLLDLREQLQRQMTGLAKQSAEEVQGYSLHMADSGTDNFDRDFALSLLSSDQDAVYEIEAALNRIEKGTYGVCELTSKPIPRVRLDAIPWTRYTVEAQAQLERDGALRRRRLGSLGSIDSVSATDTADDDEPEPEEKSKEKE
jgi:DnaK suppressor protein